jgi:hypothetical protein
MRDRIDEELSAAFRNVPVPEGFAPRLLDCLGNAQAGAKNEKVAVLRSSSLVPRVSRRTLIVGGGLLATAAGLLVAVWLGAKNGECLTERFVLDEAIQLFDLGGGQPGQLLAEKPAPPDYPFSLAVLQIRGTRWRTFEGFLGQRGVVYDLPGPTGTHAALYVVDAKDADGFDAVPTLYPFTTAGCCASSWQEGGLLYVLVVQGDPATYRAYLNRPQGPVA